MFSREGIENGNPIFSAVTEKWCRPERGITAATLPRDGYFITPGETDDREETEEREEIKLTGCDMLVRDIQKFLRRHLPTRITGYFMLHFYETGSSCSGTNRQAHRGEDIGDNPPGTGHAGIRPSQPDVHSPEGD